MGNAESGASAPRDFHHSPRDLHHPAKYHVGGSSEQEYSYDNYRYSYSQSEHIQQSSFIADNFSSLDQVTAALKEAGLESSNLILGIDFTKSNDWTGKHSFSGKSLHHIDNSHNTPNPYEQAISIIGRTLSPFDEDNLIPCFGFGDGKLLSFPYLTEVRILTLLSYDLSSFLASTHDRHVFSFYPDNRSCNGFEEVLTRYRQIVPHLRLSGPTSFAPLVYAAIDVVERNNWQYHVLVIIADGQVTTSSGSAQGRFSSQEQATIDAIVLASHYPLSIIMVGVGDGPWDSMQRFDDYIPQRKFDNFQFVNFTKIMSGNVSTGKKETAFALAALMEIPLQYKATLGLRPEKHGDGHGSWVPLPPPREVIEHDNAVRSFSAPTSFQAERHHMPRSRFLEFDSSSARSSDHHEPEAQMCPVCLTKPKNLAFGCGHLTCKECSESLRTCPICRTPITTRLRLYT